MADSRHSIRKNYIYNTAYQFSIIFFPLITMPHVARVLGPAGVGTYSYVLSIVGYFVLFINLGVATYGQINVSGLRDDKKRLSDFLGEIILTKLFVFLCVICCYLIFVSYIAQKDYKIFYCILVSQLLVAFFDFTWFLQGLEEFSIICVRKLIAKVVETGLIFAFVRDKNDIECYLIIITTCEFIGNLFLIPIIKRNIIFKWATIDFSKIKSHILNALVYFIPTIATTIYLTIDKSMIGWFAIGKDENGYYEQAQKLSQMAANVVTGISVVTMPRMAYLLEVGKSKEFQNRLEKSIKFVLFISFPMCFGIIGVSDYLIPLFLGNGYEKSIILLQIFSVLMVIIGLNNAIGKQVLMASKRQKEYNISVIAGAIINVLFNVILIPRYYSYGAAVSSVAAELSVLFGFLIFSKKEIKIGWIIRNSIQYVISALIMFIIVYSVHSVMHMSWFALISLVIIGIIVYFVVLLVMRNEMAGYLLVYLRKLAKVKSDE